MESISKDKVIELINQDSYREAVEVLIKLIKDPSSPIWHKKYMEWTRTRTKEEKEIKSIAFDYEEKYFSDMLLEDYKDELYKVSESTESLTLQESIDLMNGTYNPDLENLEMEERYYDDYTNSLNINKWRIVLLDGLDYCGSCNGYEKLIEISNDYNDKDTLLHEMIHAYEFMLEQMELDDYVLLKLYDELSPKIEDLKRYISLDKHEVFREHSLLFMLKSFKLDLELDYKIGTIYAYGRTELYED